MSKKYIWSLAFNVLSHTFAWVIPGAFTLMTYGFFYETALGRITFLGIVAALIAIRYIMYRLKITVESGYGIEKEMAREFRFLIPLAFILLIVFMINQNMASLADVLFVATMSNIPGSLFRLVSYRLSKRYENDISGRETLNLLKAKL